MDARQLASARLDDKYRVETGQVFITGVQALIKLPLLRRWLDTRQGLNTAGFISGYRGSPLGSYDKQLFAERERLTKNHIIFRPGINEELAATAVWGSQQTALFEGARYDGVFGIWYGKGPGVDRAGDALKHANYNGTAQAGGVLALAGDDHSCKSSTLPNQSDFAFMDAEIPVLNPAGVAEVLEFGLKALAMSRFAGLWAGMKAIADVMDASATVNIGLSRYATRLPAGVTIPPGGLNARLHRTPQQTEELHRHFRLPAALAFARTNGFDRIAIGSTRPRLGIAASGKAYLHVRQALADLGISEALAAEMGLSVYKVGLTWPLEPQGARAFADGLETVLVVEERRDVIEHQLRAVAYGLPPGRQPRILGKHDASGAPLISDLLDLDTADVVRAMMRVMPEEWKTDKLRARAVQFNAPVNGTAAPLHIRTPFYCSGCPHNTSTKLPEGSRGMAGIGCHYIATLMDRNTEVCTQMGGEGVLWAGQAPFTDEPHVFANLGDGTYFHSGSLAIRQAVAAGDNITFKILYNDAVAMTGGQAVDGQLSVPLVAAQVAAEGVKRIAIVSDDPDRHRGDPLVPHGTTFDHRSALDALQQELRQTPGVSVLIYDQVCANERRRRRKRGKAVPSPRRIFINEAVCEDCGDCSVQSNCLSVEPVETEFGRKRRINQSSCNQDFTCADGFCPSFVSVIGGEVKRRAAALDEAPELPEPAVPALGAEPFNILITGIGGLGVSSLADILGEAAHLDGRQVRVADQTGLAQKGGAVTSHIRIGLRDGALYSQRIGPKQAGLLLAADAVVAHGSSGLPFLSRERTAVIADSHVTPTAEFVANNAVRFDAGGMMQRLKAAARTVDELPATDLAATLLGDAIYANMLLLGYAWQRGLVPVSGEAIARAIELNAVRVAENKRAFALGREAALDKAAVLARLAPPPQLSRALDELLAVRMRHLEAYQDAAYAAHYKAIVDKVRARETEVAPGSERLTTAVARSLHKLMAVKDEYEVARLFTDGTFQQALKAQFSGSYRLAFHMAPPFLPVFDSHTRRPVKRTFGPWMLPVMRLLARMKRWRGAWFDIFNRTAERRRERALAGDYMARLERLLPVLSRSNLPLAAEYAGIPGMIRGFGHVKARNIEAAGLRYAELEAALFAPSPFRLAAE